MNIAQCIARCSDPYRAAVTSHSFREEIRDPDGLHVATRYAFEDESELTFKVTYSIEEN